MIPNSFLKTLKSFIFTIKNSIPIQTREYPSEAYPKRIKKLESKLGKDIKKKMPDSQFRKEFDIPDRFRALRRVDPEKCINCGQCVRICPNNCLELVELGEDEFPEYGGDKFPQLYYGRCSVCGLCVDICPTGAMQNSNEHKLTKYKKEDLLFSPDELFIEREERK